MNGYCIYGVAAFVLMFAIQSKAQSIPDPTRPYGYGQAPMIVEESELPKELASWKLNGIRIAGEDRQAILNGKVVHVGDEVDKAKVLEINPGNVLLEYDNQRILVRLLDVDVKRAQAPSGQTGK
jgi:hypothetical protein